MKQITLYSKLGLPTLAAIIVPASSSQDLVKDDTRLATALAELIITDGCLVARIPPTGENMPYQTVQHYDNTSTNNEKLQLISGSKHLSLKVMIAPGAISLRKWLFDVSRVALIGALAISGCTSEHWGGGVQDKQTQQGKGSAATKPLHKEVGEASWYGPGFQGQETASGETFDQKEMTAAHPSLPMGTKAKVTNLENGKKVEVSINDRGPYAENRVIDLSSAAANKLDMKEDGTTQVKIETKKPVKKKSTAKHSSKKKMGAKSAKSSN
ncbi:MAG: septal ring lytic transglycosylase RlpA family protein [Methylococcales bacterium]|nr:septal ring lytic transglycosylase RlpA family protein [Methylococcales bacterium]